LISHDALVHDTLIYEVVFLRLLAGHWRARKGAAAGPVGGDLVGLVPKQSSKPP